jgi:diguanylate cyclase (GGDEF)-like protein
VSLRAKLTVFFIAIVVIPLVVAGLMVRSAIAREVRGRTDIRLQGDARALGIARLAMTESIGQRARTAAADVAEALARTGDDPGSVRLAVERAWRGSGLDFVVLARPDVSGAGSIIGAAGAGRFLDPALTFTPETLVRPGPLASLLIRTTVPLARGGQTGEHIGDVYAGVFLDQDQAAALSRVAGGVRFEIPIAGKIAVSTLTPLVQLTSSPSSGAFDLPGDLRGLIVDVRGVASSRIAIVAPFEGDVGGLRSAILIVVFGSVLVATLLGFGLARIVSEPIRRLADEAVAVLSDRVDEETRERPADEVASLASTITTMSEHLHEAERLSMTDALTGIGNRRFLELTLSKEVERSRRYERGLSVLMVDIDRFKPINDRHGHDLGDRVLTAVAHRIEGSIRNEIDTVVRFGGEEFLVLLPETGPAGALAVAERIRKAVAGEPFGALFGASIPVTVSVGLASYPEHARDAHDLVRFADLAMYRAKRNGRNRVESSRAHRGAGRHSSHAGSAARPGIDS